MVVWSRQGNRVLDQAVNSCEVDWMTAAVFGFCLHLHMPGGDRFLRGLLAGPSAGA